MEILLTTLVLFVASLLVPAFASATTREEDAARFAREAAEQEQRRLAAIDQTNLSLSQQAQLKNQITIATLELEKAEKKLEIAAAKAGSKSAAYINNLRASLDTINESIRKTSEQFQATQSFAQGLTTQLQGMTGVAGDLGSTLVGSFIKAREAGVPLGDVLKQVRVNLQEGFSSGRVLYSVLEKVQEATIEVARAQDAAMASFARATGVSGDFDQSITDAFFSARRFGVSMQDAGAAAQSLYSGMSAFSTLNRATATELVRTVSLMNEFGIATDSSSRALDEMTRSLNMSAMEAAQMSVRLVNMAESIGVPPARLMEELSSVAPRLAQWGDNMVGVFLELQGAAKATGIALGNLVGIAGQFDTFEGAAEAAGRLNAMLGGPYLNSIELLNATEGERIRMLIRSIELTGRSWASMGRFERQAIAAAAGINNMSEANRIFGQSLAAYDAATNAAMANAAANKRLEERAAAAQEVGQLFMMTLQTFAVSVRPIVVLLRGFAENILAISNYITKSPMLSFLAQTAVVVGTVTAALVSFGLTMAATRAGLASLSASFGSATTSVGLFSGAIRFLAMGTHIGVVLSLLGAMGSVFTDAHSDTFPTAIGKAAANMRDLANSASMALPSLRAINKEIPTTARAVATIAMSDTSKAVRAGAQGVTMVRVTESANMKQMFGKLLASQEHYAKRIEAVTTADTVLTVNDREWGRATRGMINREMRIR